MKTFEIFIGIDVSKGHLDFSVFNTENGKNTYLGRFKNNYEDIDAALKKISLLHKNKKQLFCMESTGYYSEYVAFFLHQKSFCVWVENALRIKRSLGLTRGKNDKTDSERIAEYAFRHHDKCSFYCPPSEPISKLQRLQRLRENLVDSQKRLSTHLNEAKKYVSADELTFLEAHSEDTLSALKKNIGEVNKVIRETIDNEPEIKKNFDLACSVPGVGQVTATEIIIATRNFTLFENARQLACYCGVAPFEFSSGKILGRRRVSKLADIRLKTLLHLCAVSALSIKEGELRRYYDKKTSEGKNKTLVINALRNKIIHRIFACVTKGIPYDPNYKDSLATKAQTQNLPVECATQRNETGKTSDILVPTAISEAQNVQKPDLPKNIENEIVDFVMAKKTHRGRGSGL